MADTVRHDIVRPDEPDYDRLHVIDGSGCWCNPAVEQVPAAEPEKPAAPAERPTLVILRNALARYDHELDNLIETQKILEQRIVRIRQDVTEINRQRVDLITAINEVAS
jgi:hypothetical protein